MTGHRFIFKFECKTIVSLTKTLHYEVLTQTIYSIVLILLVSFLENLNDGAECLTLPEQYFLLLFHVSASIQLICHSFWVSLMFH